ncbi:hypothetical protein SPRG_00357 [Saprolegnia parasitica CBS 223.65]|uniref:Uncharacterized protein n=1 Tax=Saprolegnia parasitica (strain CBS 223.65) TaxID=695850 RepID=A0A067D1Y1_SAPPC|nr:hypothetical protein SPRG_00357 [Saprolegnia parasitica CBS 223.65]KDO35510.1 hypothetical protein SPRG_00357 [Saprolegnia parasitica CBS 223.65]|eukprot:XP_012193846.1 hypothetical protein SPRG_00357 [Saprolegnia parasitica CBS 223.65]
MPGPLCLLQTVVADGLSLATGVPSRGSIGAFARALVLSTPLLCLPLLVCWKLDGGFDRPWTETLLGLWILDATLLLRSLLPIGKTPFATRQLVARVLFVATHVAVALRLDDHVDWHWSSVFLPMALSLFCGASPVPVLQVLLLGLHLDGFLTWSYLVLLAPMWGPLLVVGVVLPMGALWTSGSMRHNVMRLVASWAAAALLMGPPLLLVARLEYACFPAIYIALPWIVLYALCVLGALASSTKKASRLETFFVV